VWRVLLGNTPRDWIHACKDIMSRNPVKINRYLGEIYRLHIQGLRVIQGRIQHDAGS
jgi:hypothetical protein